MARGGSQKRATGARPWSSKFLSHDNSDERLQHYENVEDKYIATIVGKWHGCTVLYKEEPRTAYKLSPTIR